MAVATAPGRRSAPDRRRRRDAGVPRHGHRHGQADRRRPGRGAAPLPRSRRPRPTSSPWPTSPHAANAAIAQHPAVGAGAPLLVAGTGLYLRRSPIRWRSPARGPTSAPRSRRGWPPASRSISCIAQLSQLDPGGGGQDASRPTLGAWCARSRCAWAAVARSARSARASTRTRPSRSCRSACAGHGPCWPSASSGACTA